MSTPIDGCCAPGFDAVREAFAANFAERGEVGAAVHVIVGGEVVVDLVGGWADEARTRPWRHDTIVDVYSVGKAILALLALQLVDEGRLALDQPIADVWPEFAAGGKAGATVAHALSHRAGVPAIRELLTDDDLFDWERMTGRARRHRGVVGAGRAAGVPHQHVRPPRRRAGPPGQRPDAGRRGCGRVAEPLGADVWFGVPADRAAPLRRRRVGAGRADRPPSTRSTGSRATCS